MLDKDFGERSGWICEPRFHAEWVVANFLVELSRTIAGNLLNSNLRARSTSLAHFNLGQACLKDHAIRAQILHKMEEGALSDGLQCLSWFCLRPRFKPEINTYLTFKWILIIEQMLRLGRVKATALHFRGFIKVGHGLVATEFSLKSRSLRKPSKTAQLLIGASVSPASLSMSFTTSMLSSSMLMFRCWKSLFWWL